MQTKPRQGDRMPTAAINRRAYAKGKVLDYYDQLSDLFPAEKALFEKLSREIRNAKVLDIGIGGGRTTRYLLPLAAEYTGIDYVPEYIDRVRRKYEKGNFLVVDARNLTVFVDESFDLVVFSYNGLDVVSHEDRLTALKEIYRVLRKGGTFIFSSHNRDYQYFNRPYWFNQRRFNMTLIKGVLSYLFFLPRHLWMKQHEESTDEYATINDSDHRYSMLVYYIGIAEQAKQLEDIGFSNVEAYNAAGESVRANKESFWIYYLANR